ncbi:hypothetical protein ACFE04_030915 [Oxalis oulophora]
METFPIPCCCIYHLDRALQEVLYVTPRHKAVAGPRLNTIGVPLYSDRIWSYSWKEKIASMWKIDHTDAVDFQLYNLAKTKTGSKRLQGLLSRNSPRITWKILILVSDSIFELMADKYAHHLIKTLIDSCHQNQFQLQLQLVVTTLTLDSTILTQALNNKYTVNSVKILDPFGNFVIQHVIELQLPQTTEKLCSTLKNHFVDLSLQKAGSHVVEKCLNSSGMRLEMDFQ